MNADHGIASTRLFCVPGSLSMLSTMDQIGSTSPRLDEPTARARRAESTPPTRSPSTRRERTPSLPRESDDMTASRVVTVVRPSLLVVVWNRWGEVELMFPCYQQVFHKKAKTVSGR